MGRSSRSGAGRVGLVTQLADGGHVLEVGPPAVDPLDALHALDAAAAAGDHAVDGVGRAGEVHGPRGVG